MTPTRKPSPALVLAFIALLVALGGTALAATGALVTITDPTNAANQAKVDATGKLAVGDGTGALTVDGTVVAQPGANPANFSHQSSPLAADSGCFQIAKPPANKALVVRQVRLDVTVNPTPGGNDDVFLVAGPNCGGVTVGHLTPDGTGQTVVPFDPGLGLPTGSVLWGFTRHNLVADAYADGYIVGASAVSSTNATSSRKVPRRR